ncbi:MAG: EF-hand domain-containing protein [Kiritimatiellia bacterium]|nr:EF-hand domain-containing protein [Lentisphaerota bacterium]
MNKNKLVGYFNALLVVAWAAALLGCAAPKGGAAPSLFEQLDRGAAGRLTRSEFAEGMPRVVFDEIDQDGDGKIDLEEWLAASRDEAAARRKFQELDRDGNRRLSFLEFSEAAAERGDFDEMFKAMDHDRDGHLSPVEFNARPSFRIFSIEF